MPPDSCAVFSLQCITNFLTLNMSINFYHEYIQILMITNYCEVTTFSAIPDICASDNQLGLTLGSCV